MKNDINKIKSYEIKWLLNKRQIARREVKYLMKWRDYESEHDVWRNLFELENVMKLINEYEEIFQQITAISQKFSVEKFSADIFDKQQKIAFAEKQKIAQSFEVIDKELIIYKKSSAIVEQKIVERQKIVLVRKASSIEQQKIAFAEKKLIVFKKFIAVERQKIARSKKLFVINKSMTTSFASSFVVVISEKFFTVVVDDSQFSSVTDAMILRRSNRLQNQ